jgi:hypothetical protein
MSTFSEYLEKTVTQSKENQGLKNIKIKGGNEVVNESDEDSFFDISLKKDIKKLIFDGYDPDNFGDLEAGNLTEEILDILYAWMNEKNLV